MIIIGCIYLVCCVLGLAFSIAGMLLVDRKLGYEDLVATLFFTSSGFIGTIILIVLLIKFFRKELKK